jgi:phosphoribosylanthranilate isomerase
MAPKTLRSTVRRDESTLSLWIKICGNTSLADAQLAAVAGADAVGFVFAPSPRRVTAELASAITPHLPAEIEKIGVFVDADFAEIVQTVKQAGLTGVQLHAGGDGALAERLRVQFGPGLRLLQVIHFGADAVEELRAASGNRHIDGILVDSRTATAVGGTGIAFDWKAARATVFSSGSGLKLIAAGGLTPDNVAQAVAILRPWGVDVASGVEAVPGRKDPSKVAEFVANARASAGV